MLEKLKIKHYLLLVNFCLTFFLILFSHLNLLNLTGSNFIFAAILVVIFSLYRPGWAFVFLIGTIALENINLAPENWPLIVRPYQLLGASIGISLLVRFFLKKINFSLPKLRWFDFLIIFLVALSFLSAFFAQDREVALKLSLVFSSFVFIYFLGRIYLQNLDDIKRTLPFFLSSSFLIVSYGIIQNWLFTHNLLSGEVMPGRSNATFQEPDWLGIYLVLLLSLSASLVYFLSEQKSDERKKKISKTLLFILLTLTLTLLILTVSRSAWLGTILVLLFLLFATFTNLSFQKTAWDFEKARSIFITLIVSLLLSLGIVKFGNLTNFELGNRLQSSGSGEQEITVSCQSDVSLPEKIESNEELNNFNCRHINLEEIDQEKAAGNFVKRIKRSDPNFDIRSQIYETSWQEIRNHWFSGIGWGNIGKILGTDERGATLNASNLFLEIYLGTGIMGFLAFSIIWFFIFLKNIWKFFFAKDPQHKALALFIIITIIGLTVTNLFNSGIMLGFLWIFLAVSLDKK